MLYSAPWPSSTSLEGGETPQPVGVSPVKWWVLYVLRKRERIISKAKAKYWRTTHKYGVKLPNNVKEALHLDTINGNTFWRDAPNKKMGKAKVAYEYVPRFTVCLG